MGIGKSCPWLCSAPQQQDLSVGAASRELVASFLYAELCKTSFVERPGTVACRAWAISLQRMTGFFCYPSKSFCWPFEMNCKCWHGGQWLMC